MELGRVFLFVVSLLLSCVTQDTSSETTQFVQAGKDLFLWVKESVALGEDDEFIWKLNDSRNVVRISSRKVIINKNYKGRVVVKNYSLVLKDAQQNDSGEYRAYVSGDRDYTVVEYKITVQNPVSPVELRVDSVSRMSDSCNLNVTCSSQESHINSIVRCDKQTCSQEGGRQSEVPASGASLHVYLLNASIVCNHSNQVSWTKKMADNLCTKNYDSQQQPRRFNIVIVAIMVPAVAIVIILAVVILQNRKKGKTENIKNAENTVSDIPQMDATPQPLNQSERSDQSPTSTYCLVGPHTGPVKAAEAKGNTVLESLYAQVEKPART